MKKPLYSIYDSAAKFYSPTFQAENDVHAVRMMSQSIDHMHKADFNLYQVAAFDGDSGVVSDCEIRLVQKGQSLGE